MNPQESAPGAIRAEGLQRSCNEPIVPAPAAKRLPSAGSLGRRGQSQQRAKTRGKPTEEDHQHKPVAPVETACGNKNADAETTSVKDEAGAADPSEISSGPSQASHPPRDTESLLPQHQKLIDDSAIAPVVAAARGYRSVTSKSELKRLGFSDRQCRTPALLIPMYNERAEIVLYQIRPDQSRVGKDGKLIKYETPAKAKMRLDIPPGAATKLGDPAVPLFITEGVRKADSAVSKGLCTIALIGVWNWRDTNDAGGKTALSEWESIALNDRKVSIVFDSDIVEKEAVLKACDRLAAFLKHRGAHVVMARLPHGAGGKKVGLDDFFATSNGRPANIANAVALLLAPFVREAIDGPTPLHLLEKPTPGSGASLLAEICCGIFSGGLPSFLLEGGDEDEWRKRLTATLATGPSHVVIDNLKRPLDSAALSSAITSPMYEDRILGQSRTIRIPVRCIWVASGNNPTLSNELARRVVPIRLEPAEERPWERDPDAFKHPDLRRWVRENRGHLVWAALTLARHWVAEGRPEETSVRLGSFESYVRVVGGILKAAEIPDFLGNTNEFYARVDTESDGVKAFLAEWWRTYASERVAASELFTIAYDQSNFDLDAKTERGSRTRFGCVLSKLLERVYRVPTRFDRNGKPTALTNVMAKKDGVIGGMPHYRLRSVDGELGERSEPSPSAHDDPREGDPLDDSIDVNTPPHSASPYGGGRGPPGSPRAPNPDDPPRAGQEDFKPPVSPDGAESPAELAAREAEAYRRRRSGLTSPKGTFGTFPRG